MKWYDNHPSPKKMKELKMFKYFSFGLIGIGYTAIILYIYDFQLSFSIGFTISLLFGWCIASLSFIGIWCSEIKNPKRIAFDNEGVYIMPIKGKKEFIPWTKILAVQHLTEYGKSSNPEYGYYFTIKNSFISDRILDKKNGMRLQELYKMYSGNIDMRIKITETITWKLILVGIIGTIILSMILLLGYLGFIPKIFNHISTFLQK